MQDKIKIYIAPYRISQEEWEKVWLYTLQLAQAAGILDSAGTEHKGQEYRCTRFSDRVSPVSDTEGFSGCQCFDGCYSRTGRSYTFGISDDIKSYQARCTDNDPGEDLLVSLFSANRFVPTWVVNIWENFTVPRHTFFIPLLGIACLLNSQFPHAVLVSGDVSAGQCCRAARWASNILGIPVNVPAIASPARVLERVLDAGLPPLESLHCAFSAYTGPRDKEWGDLLRRHYDATVLYQYFNERFTTQPVDSDAFEETLKMYLEMGMDLHDLCRLLVTAADGCHMDPQKFLAIIVRSNLHVRQKQTYDITKPAYLQGWCEDVDSEGMSLTRMLARFFGARNHNVDAYMPLTEICDVFRAELASVDVDEEIDRLIAQQEVATDDLSAYFSASGLCDSFSILLNELFQKMRE